jgi:putative ABC transport system permease protein
VRLIRDAAADIRFAARSFKRAPGFAATALVTLVVGIAAVTSIFSYLDALYFARFPYKDADRTVALNEVRRGDFGSFSSLSLDAVGLIRQSSRSFDRLTVYREAGAIASIGAVPLQIHTLRVDSAFIPFFDLRPEVGRLLTREEVDAGAAAVMISDQLWRDEYGSDPSILERRLTLDDHSFVIVGVMPPGFRFPYQTDAVTGNRFLRDSAAAHDLNYSMIGKLRSGATPQSARSELRVIGSRLRAIDAAVFAHAELDVQDEMIDRKARQFLPLPGAFLGTGLFVLLIACANVANLLLARAAERRSEMAVRASLGASRWRLMRQTLGETLLLGAIAAALGTAASAALVRLGLHFIPTQGFPSWFRVAVDLNVLAFAVGVTVLVTAAAGLIPALEGTRFDLVRALKLGGDGGSAPSGIARASRRGLAVQLALAVALFVSAALLARSYRRIATFDVGYPADRIAILTPLVDRLRYSDPASQTDFAERLAERTARIPGVTSVALRGGFLRLRTTADSTAKRPAPAGAQRYDGRLIPDADTIHALRSRDVEGIRVVSDDYFAMLNLRVRKGRSFAPDDVRGSTPVTVISDRMARALWPTSSPLGHTIQVGASGDKFTVIGVVDDVRRLRGGGSGFTDAPLLTSYVSGRQAFAFIPELLLTGRGDVVALRSHAVSLVRAADPNLILFRDVTLANELDQALLVTRVFGGLIAVFAIAALGLSIIGIYGVIAFGVAQRTREIGIRIALGGTSRDVMRVIVVDGLRFVGYGLLAGVVLAAALAQVLKTLLFGVSSIDPIAYVAVCALFAAVAILACYWPARRATRVDPLVALRAD